MRRNRLELWAFLGILGLMSLPIWLFPYFPSQDGPSHLYNSFLLSHWLELKHTAFGEYYYLNFTPNPNWLGHLLLAGMMRAVPPLIAEKILLTLYIFGLPLAFRFALASLRPSQAALSWIALPFVYHVFLYYGFYNFCLGIIGFFLLLGFWIRQRNAASLFPSILLTLGHLLLYFTHPVLLSLCWIAMAILFVWEVGLHAWNSRFEEPTLSKRLRQHFMAALRNAILPALPALILLLLFITRGKDADIIQGVPFSELKAQILTPFISFSAKELDLARIALAVFAASLTGCTLSFIRRKPEFSDGLLIGSVFFLLLYFILPSGLGGGEVLNPRVLLMFYMTAALWLSTCVRTRFWQYTLQGTSLLFTVVFLSLHIPVYHAFNRQLHSYLSAVPRLAAYSTILPLTTEPRGRDEQGELLSEDIKLFLHTGNYPALSQRLINLDNYEAARDYFPLRFYLPIDPFQYFSADGLVKALPDRQDIESYEKQTLGKIDTILLWGRNALASKKMSAAFIRFLESGYEPVNHTSSNEKLTVYKKKVR